VPTPPIDLTVDDSKDAGPIAIDISDNVTIRKLIVAALDDTYPLQSNIAEDPLTGFIELFTKYVVATLPVVYNNSDFISMCKKLNIKFLIVNS
jgi:hypothetical protein